MDKGIIYLMTTAVNGLVKIGKTGTENFPERMRFLEANGYYNVSGLKKEFAIEVEDYDSKEKLLHEVFEKHRVGESELFALESDLVKQLLLSFEGKVVYPEAVDKEEEFDEVATSRLFSFSRKGLAPGEVIHFKDDERITATVVDDRKVKYDREIYYLSPLTKAIYQRDDTADKNYKAYRGSDYWTYDEKILTDLPDTLTQDEN